MNISTFITSSEIIKFESVLYRIVSKKISEITSAIHQCDGFERAHKHIFYFERMIRRNKVFRIELGCLLNVAVIYGTDIIHGTSALFQQ